MAKQKKEQQEKETLEIKYSEDKKIFAPLKNDYLVLKPEEKVRQEYICKLVNDYGYSLEQMDQEVQVNNSTRGQGKAQADIIIWKSKEDKANSKTPIIVVECKADYINISEKDYFQGQNYASWARAKFFITHNNKETKFFRVNEDKMPTYLDEIIGIPNAGEIEDKHKINKYLTELKTFSRDEFARLLHKCHNIIRNNDKLSPEAAFDEISKILFMKIRYERSKDKKGIFSLERFEGIEESYKEAGDTKSVMQTLFDNTKEEFEKDKLFEEEDTIRIREYSFKQIVRELERYDLSNTGDDIKGIAFEKFLGTTFRGELGQFFTPRPVVDFIVNILDIKEGETICDPCCGSGGFLIKAFEDVREKIENDIDEKIKKSPAKLERLKKELDFQEEGTRLYKLSHDCIYGTDANPRMARVSKMNMIMHGDGHGGVHHHDGLLNVNGIFDERFNVIITNPPFGSKVSDDVKISEHDKFTDKKAIKRYEERYGKRYTDSLNQVNNNIGDSINSLFKVNSTLTEILFIERCINLLKKGGRMGIVLPEGVLNNDNLQPAREFFEGKAKILLIVSLPQDVFMSSGATVKPSIVFLKRFSEEEEKKYTGVKKKAEEYAKEKIREKKEKSLEAMQQADELAKEANKKYQEAKKNKQIGNTALKKLEESKNKYAEEKKEAIKKDKETLKSLEKEEKILIRAYIKESFDYEIAIAEVEKAGISSTGDKIDNELEGIVTSFRDYRDEQAGKGAPLW